MLKGSPGLLVEPLTDFLVLHKQPTMVVHPLHMVPLPRTLEELDTDFAGSPWQVLHHKQMPKQAVCLVGAGLKVVDADNAQSKPMASTSWCGHTHRCPSKADMPVSLHGPTSRP